MKNANFRYLLTGWPTLSVLSAIGTLGLYMAENHHLSMPLAGCIFVLIVAAFFMVTRRLAFAICASWAIIAVITLISAIKFQMKGFSLHFYDAVVMAGDREMYRFLIDVYPMLIVPVLVLLVAAVASLILVHRVDRPREISIGGRMALLLLPLVLLPATYPAEASVMRYFYYLQGRHMTAFFVSLLDARFLFQPSDLKSRLDGLPDGLPFEDKIDCGDGPRPDVFIILGESQVDPRIFPQIGEGAEIAAAMEASAGPLQPLQVETFGGGTWISNLSVMTGLSATDFGWRSPYLTISLQDRIGGALPEIFARCGYRTAAMLPLNYTFVNEGPFLKSIGFETVVDKDAMGATTYHHRDKFYFEKAEEFIRENRRTDGRPLFLLVQTMFPHSPYDQVLEPELSPGMMLQSSGTDLGEYLRRLVIAYADLAEFTKRRQEEARDHPSVTMTFGDHQVFATKPFVTELAGSAALADPRSLGYRTFFAIWGDADQPEMPLKPVDIPFLGNHILRAAEIPGTPMTMDLARIERICDGRFHMCAQREVIDRHLKRRVASGLLRLPEGS